MNDSIEKVLSGAEQWCVVQGDSRELVPQLCNATIGMIITDPPYGISHPCNFNSRGRGRLSECRDYYDVAGDSESFDPEFLLALKVPTCLWGANWFADKLPPSGGWLVWDKERPDDLDQATCELAWTNFVKGVRRFKCLWNGMMRGGNDGPLVHPTQKPVVLMSWILGLRWTTKSLVLDPYCGSGPVGIAAVRSGRQYIGIELVEEYCQIARERIARAEREPGLFTLCKTNEALDVPLL